MTGRPSFPTATEVSKTALEAGVRLTPSPLAEPPSSFQNAVTPAWAGAAASSSTANSASVAIGTRSRPVRAVPPPNSLKFLSVVPACDPEQASRSNERTPEYISCGSRVPRARSRMGGREDAAAARVVNFCPPMSAPTALRIAFVRPGLGIGGAERLVVDAALELDARGHDVTLYVGDRQEAQLDEVKAGRVKVVAVGRKLPAHVAQRLRAPAAILRASWAARALARVRPAPDVVGVDLVPHVIPLVRRLVKAPVACYCHFPDLLLAPRRRGLYALYRAPLDR